MLQTNTTIQKNKNNFYKLTNFVFAFFPISFVLGSLAVNINIFLLCCLGIFYLKFKILKTNYNFAIKIIFLFFLTIIFSTSIDFLKTLYFEGYENIYEIPKCYNTNCLDAITRLTKSILFFRFYLLLIIIYLLSKSEILNFKYFFFTAAIISLILSLDIIYQFNFGFNIIGLKGGDYYNSGFFGDEYVAGGFILRFSFFSVLFAILVFKNTNYIKFIFIPIVICILGVGILFAGSRMPLILFIFGLFLFLLFNFQIKKVLLSSLIILFIILNSIFLSNESYKNHLLNAYESFVGQAKTLVNITGVQKWKKTKRIEGQDSLQSKTTFIEAKHEGLHRRIYLAALDTWKFSDTTGQIFGNGIKSFREDCWKLEKKPNYYLGEALQTGKKNRLCSNHPHNYYLEILVETGILGIFTIFIAAFIFLSFVFKNLRSAKYINVENCVLLSAIISLAIETLPLRSAGSLFSTNNATYLTLIASIVLSYKYFIKNNVTK